MDNNGFSKSAVDEVKNSEDFLSMSGVEHLVLCIEERDNGNYNRFLAHADAVLGWHRTKNAVKFIMNTMHGFYGYKALEVVYESIPKQDVEDRLWTAAFDCLRTSFSFEKFGSDFSDHSTVADFYSHWMNFYLRNQYRLIVLEYAKTFYPNLDKTQMIKYVRMRKNSGYTVDLDDPDEVVADVLGGVSERSVKSLRTAFAEFDDYYLLTDTSSKADPAVIYEKQEISLASSNVAMTVIQSLSDRDRAIVIGSFVDQKECRTLADEIGCSKSTISYVINKVRNQLLAMV